MHMVSHLLPGDKIHVLINYTLCIIILACLCVFSYHVECSWGLNLPDYAYLHIEDYLPKRTISVARKKGDSTSSKVTFDVL